MVFSKKHFSIAQKFSICKYGKREGKIVFAWRKNCGWLLFLL
jgi:hypothetical protein